MKVAWAGLTWAALLVGVQVTASAQAGWSLIPSFSLAEEFDDNVFVTSTAKKSDFITRFTPGIDLGYRSEPFTLMARSSFDTEIFADNSQLNDSAARKRAGLEFKYVPFEDLTLGLDSSYIATTTATGLVGAAGLEFARRDATEFILSPVAHYRFTASDTGRIAYTFMRDTLDQFPDTTTNRAQLTYSHQFSALDTGLLAYRLSVFKTEDLPGLTSHTPAVGWTRQFSQQTALTLQAGPRFKSDGSVEPEAVVRLEHAFTLAKVAAQYLRTETFVLGRTTAEELEALSGSIELEPFKLLKVKVEPSYTRLFGGVDPTARIYGVASVITYPITSWLTAGLRHVYAFQDQVGASLHHNIVTLSLDAAYPITVSK